MKRKKKKIGPEFVKRSISNTANERDLLTIVKTSTDRTRETEIALRATMKESERLGINLTCERKQCRKEEKVKAVMNYKYEKEGRSNSPPKRSVPRV